MHPATSLDLSLRLNIWAACLSALYVAGCDCAPPIVQGGGERSRANYEAGLEDFFASVVEGAVCIQAVHVGDVPGTPVGDYNPTTRVIRVESGEDLPEEQRDLAEWGVMTHEACHAGADQLGIALGSSATWWFETEAYAAADVPREGFAYSCQFGGKASQLLGESCPSDTEGAEAFPFVLHHLYTRTGPGVFIRVPTWDAVASASLPGAETVGFEARTTIHGDVRFSLLDGSAGVDVMPWTGQSVEPSALTAYVAAPTLHGTLTVLDWASTGLAEILIVEAVAPNEGVARRLLYVDEEGSSRLGCPHLTEAVFAVDGEAWSAHAEGDVVYWGIWRVE